MIGHVTPEAVRGGPNAGVCDGDVITIDVDTGRLAVDVAAGVLAARARAWQPLPDALPSAALAKFRAPAASASDGAFTNPLLSRS